MGRIMAVTPMMTSMLKRLDPTTLPIASPADPLMADMTEMTSSGADVPKATTVSPTTRSEMPNRRAMAAEPSVSQLAEKYERHTDDEIYDVKYHSVWKGILNSIDAYLSANIENY